MSMISHQIDTINKNVEIICIELSKNSGVEKYNNSKEN